MNFSFFIAKRYLISKKSKNAINIISLISVFGVAIGTAALVIVLSVFNGFDNLLESMYNSFDPDLKISIAEGKTFNPNCAEIEKIKKLESVEFYSETLEENALLKYNNNQYFATVKGVDSNFRKISGVDTMIIGGEFLLYDDKGREYAIVGQGIAYFLSLGINYIDPIIIYVPRRNATITMNPEQAFNRKYIYPSGIFGIQQEFDTKYIIVPLKFARELLDYENNISALELKVKSNNNIDKVQNKIQSILGNKYIVQNRFQQHETFYKIMKSEKWAIFIILTFILIVASFNIIGSLSMLIIDKKDDISTLRSIGANLKSIRYIFLFEGWMISIVGAIIGLFTGLFICWLQITFGFLKMGNTGSFIINTYPVAINFIDTIIIFFTVLIIGWLAAWFPVKYITKKYILNS
ncbi:MAG: FtsX-like permease family protein [Bacteroidota bacterium]|nr:FtsX-like permease family protein [Bacteroidota bacterium]